MSSNHDSRLESFSNQQIDALQQQIRLYKQLGKRYMESKIPKSSAESGKSNVNTPLSNKAQLDSKSGQFSNTTSQSSSHSYHPPVQTSNSNFMFTSQQGLGTNSTTATSAGMSSQFTTPQFSANVAPSSQNAQHGNQRSFYNTTYSNTQLPSSSSNLNQASNNTSYQTYPPNGKNSAQFIQNHSSGPSYPHPSSSHSGMTMPLSSAHSNSIPSHSTSWTPNSTSSSNNLGGTVSNNGSNICSTPNCMPSTSSGVASSVANSPVAPSVNPLAPTPTLSWQCFNSLLFPGPSKNLPEGMIGLSVSDMGCFSKSSHFPLVLTLPFAMSLREKFLKNITSCSDAEVFDDTNNSSDDIGLHKNPSNSNDNIVKNEIIGNESEKNVKSSQSVEMTESITSSNGSKALKLWRLQRRVRATLFSQVKNRIPGCHGLESYISELFSRRNYIRVRKVVKSNPKLMDEKRKRIELEERRRRKSVEFLKALLNHREELFRFHRNRRQDLIRMSRFVKQQVDIADSRREKDEVKAEAQRIRALRENDMEAYTKLVQETKNDRLQFLLSETDAYIESINAMIQQQRDANTTHSIQSASDIASDIANSSSAAFSSSSKNYMSNTHRVVESVMQPRMLKGGDLKEYQLSGLQWLVSLYNNNLNGILADEMGLGKTIQSLALISYLYEVKQNHGPYLVVCPLSTLSNWVNEANRWVPDIRKVVYKGSPVTRKQIYKEEIETGRFQLLLTTYEYIMKDKSWLKKLDWQYIIVDEGHRMKNAQSKFTQTLGTQYHSRHRLLLTGTPLQNSLPELWSLLNFLLPTIFSSVDTFDQWFNKPFAAFKQQQQQQQQQLAAGNNDSSGVVVLSQEEQMLIIHRLHEVLRPFVLRRVKSQVLDQLPEKVEKILKCEFSGYQRRLYRTIQLRSPFLASSLGSSLPGGVSLENSIGPNAQGINNVWMQLRKVCNHPYLFLNDYVVDEDLIRISGKFALLDRLLPKLRRAGHRVLMFSQMTQLMTILEHFFILRRYSFLRLDGNTSSEEREKRMHQFNDPNSPYFLFLLSTRAGGLGLNLATADTVVIFDSDWNPMMDAQAQDRAHRIGQKNEVRVFRLVTQSVIEQKILARATEKKQLNGLVVEAGQFGGQGNRGSKAGMFASSNSSSNNVVSARDQESKEMMESLLREWSGGGSEQAKNGEDQNVSDQPGSYFSDDDDNDSEVAKPENNSVKNGSGKDNNIDSVDGEGKPKVRDENSPPNDDEINKMVAAHDKELQLFRKMDEERRLKSKSSLLMSFKDRPGWLESISSWNSKYHPIAQMMEAMSRSHSQKALLKNSDSVDGNQEQQAGGEGVNRLSTRNNHYYSKKLSSGNAGDEKKLEDDDMDEEMEDMEDEIPVEIPTRDNEEEDEDLDGEDLDAEDMNEYDVEEMVEEMEDDENAVVDDEDDLDIMDDEFDYDDSPSVHEDKKRKTEKKGQDSISRSTSKSSSQSAKSKKVSSQVESLPVTQLSTSSSLVSLPSQGISPDLCKYLVKVFQDIAKLKHNNGWSICELFREKPDRKLYADYYSIVQQPISLKEITTKLKKCQYSRLEDLMNDLALMSYNAKLYNTDASIVFADAEKIRHETFSRIFQSGLVRVHGDLEDDEKIMISCPSLPQQGYLTYQPNDWYFEEILLVPMPAASSKSRRSVSTTLLPSTPSDENLSSTTEWLDPDEDGSLQDGENDSKTRKRNGGKDGKKKSDEMKSAVRRKRKIDPVSGEDLDNALELVDGEIDPLENASDSGSVKKKRSNQKNSSSTASGKKTPRSRKSTTKSNSEPGNDADDGVGLGFDLIDDQDDEAVVFDKKSRTPKRPTKKDSSTPTARKSSSTSTPKAANRKSTKGSSKSNNNSTGVPSESNLILSLSLPSNKTNNNGSNSTKDSLLMDVEDPSGGFDADDFEKFMDGDHFDDEEDLVSFSGFNEEDVLNYGSESDGGNA